MFKNIFIIALSAVVTSSCNNKDAGNTSADPKSDVPVSSNATMPQQEKGMRDLIKQFPDSLLLQENLIQYFRQNANIGQAITETNNLLKKDSLNARLWDMRATLYFENDDTTTAISSFEKAISISAQPEYIMSLGSLYAQTRNPAALEVADALYASNANAKVEALFMKGLYYNYSGDKKKAMTFFDQCLKIDYSYVLAYREKAIYLYDLGQYKEAVEFLEKSVALRPDFDEGHYWLGRCYEKLNQREPAVMNYKAALQIDPDYAEARDALAKMGIAVN